MSHGVYVHLPWCRIRCPYCAFTVLPDRSRSGERPPFSAYTDAVLAEAVRRAPDFPGPARTLFFGGGTPSRLPVPELARLIDALRPVPGGEIAAEVNPEDVEDWLDGALEAGINRVSLGIQTLDPVRARRLGRAHAQDDAARALDRVARSGVRSWSADLIFAQPDQTLADLDADLDALLAFGPPHVSVYGLTFEPGTPFGRASESGRITPPDDDLWRAMYDRLVERLGAAGLARYEISNFARPGHESEHNQGYWHERPYLGLGIGAHGMTPDGGRWVNTTDLATYLTGADPTAEREPPEPERIARDALISQLRCREGIDLDALAARTGFAPDSEVVRRLIGQGVLRADGPRVALAGDGWALGDAVVARLVDALQERVARSGHLLPLALRAR